MTRALHRRGPDDEGIEVLADGELVLGHRRLSILDLSPLGHQPMGTSDRKIWIVFNGEIYNFREIRAELIKKGCLFRSDSDTEVILEAYRTWGLQAVERFHGMFAFALWDTGTRRLHLCRDRFGVKPLYYSIRAGQLAFASELKALNVAGFAASDLEGAALAEFVRFGYVSAPRSVFAGVQALPPGCMMSFDEQLREVTHTYWSAKQLFDGEEAQSLRLQLRQASESELLDRLESALHSAFEYRMVADVPVGLFLSGGIDSSIVATLLARRGGHRLRTFTIGYGGTEFDETEYARTVAESLGAEHTEFTVTAQAALDLVQELPEVSDEPIGDSSLIPTLMVSRLARQHVTVALSADGADELFGGYARYAHCGRFVGRSRLLQNLYFLSGHVLERLPPGLIAHAYALSRSGGPKFAAINDKLRKFVRMTRARTPSEAYEATACEWTRAEAQALLKQRAMPSDIGYPSPAAGANAFDKFMHFDMVRYLPGDLLTKVDRASMFTSLEAREPFLDHEMAKLAVALPLDWKIRGSQNKYALRRILARYFPVELFDRPKKGFSAPIEEWLKGPLQPLLTEEMTPAELNRHAMLDPIAVNRATQGFLHGRGGSAAGVWMLWQLQRWGNRWLTDPGRGLDAEADAPGTQTPYRPAAVR